MKSWWNLRKNDNGEFELWTGGETIRVWLTFPTEEQIEAAMATWRKSRD